jgi:hypothetical protein
VEDQHFTILKGFKAFRQKGWSHRHLHGGEGWTRPVLLSLLTLEKFPEPVPLEEITSTPEVNVNFQSQS